MSRSDHSQTNVKNILQDNFNNYFFFHTKMAEMNFIKHGFLECVTEFSSNRVSKEELTCIDRAIKIRRKFFESQCKSLI